MKSILYISPSPSVKGGISTVIKQYLNSSLRNKYHIFRVSSHRDGSKVLKLATAAVGSLQTLYYLAIKRIDVVHLHGSGDPTSSIRKYLYFRLVKIFPCRIIYHFHGGFFLETYPTLSKFWKARLKVFYESADLIICLSESWKRDLHTIAPAAKIVIVPNSMSLPRISEHGRMHEGPLRLLFLGLICEKKGIFDLLKVIKKGIEDNRSLMLTIGGIGEVARLTDEIDRLGLRGSVEYLGWVSAEVRDMLMRKTDIFILPSYGEGMPMTILEAMSYAIPVISTPVGGIPELVIEDETGFLVKPGDLSGLYERIIELATDEEKRCRFGRRGRQVIEEKHNLSENIKTIDAIYDTI